jgi:undecaprenyl-diphosphatase
VDRVTALQAAGFGLLQGATELFPVSSVGHAVLLPAVLGWRIDQTSPTFLPFVVMLHLGTALALLAYFWRDWFHLLSGALHGRTEAERRDRRLFWLLILGTLPAAFFGALLEKRLRLLFGAPSVAAAVLAINGLLLLVGDRWGRSAGTRRADQLKPGEALIIGLWESLALVPGISRSGATLVAGIQRGVARPEAARFSFLLATPVILGAGMLEVPKLFRTGAGGALGLALLGGAVAALAAYASAAFLMRYFRRAEHHALQPFAIYCLAAGLAAYVVLRG